MIAEQWEGCEMGMVEQILLVFVFVVVVFVG